MPQFNHQVNVIRGILEQECSEMLKQFFVELRKRNKAKKLQLKMEKSEESEKSEKSSYH